MRSLADRGVFLIDLKPDPKLPDETLETYVPDLVTPPVELRPRHVITLKANVCELTRRPVRAAGLRVVDQRVPFPGSCQQRRVLEAIGAALDSIGSWR